jgi:hypothetical protein
MLQKHNKVLLGVARYGGEVLREEGDHELGKCGV